MRGYEFTERGKIIIALVVAIPLFLIAIFLGVIAWNNSQSPPDDPPVHSQAPITDEDPEISDEPLPDGSGFTPEEPPETENGEHGEFDPETIEEPPHEDFEYKPVFIDLSEGTMLFWFYPDLGDVLDDNTIFTINEFLTSPKNTDDAQIVVEMPQLPEEELSMLIAAVINAFAQNDIPQEDLAYSIYQADVDMSESSFEVKFYFLPAERQK